MDTIGGRIKKLRESSQLVAKDLCQKLEMNCSTYSKLENDKKSIDVDELKKLTQFYDVSADHILGIAKPQVDVVAYMKIDKNLDGADVEEIQKILAMMDQAVVLKNMKMDI